MNTHRKMLSSKPLLTSLLLALLLAWTAVATSAQTKRLSSGEYRVIEVAPITGDDYASGTALLNANDSVGGNNARWLLLLSPGTYDLGDRDLTMYPNVSIQGSGMESTLILGDGTTEPNFGSGVIEGADGVRLAELTVRCTNDSSTELCIAMANVGASPRIHRVRFESTGPGLHWGMRNTDSSPILEEVEIYASGGIHNYGVVNSADSYPEIQRCLITTENGSEQNIAIFDKDGGLAVRVDDTELYAVGGTHAVGLYNDGTLGDNASFADVTIRVDGGSTVTAAVYGGNYSLHVQGSNLVASGVDGRAIEMESGATLVVTDSELLADGASAIAGEIQMGSTRISIGEVSGTAESCLSVYRLPPTPEFFADTCPESTEPFTSKSMIRIVEAG